MPSQVTRPTVLVIVLEWNGWDVFLRCLDSIAKSLPNRNVDIGIVDVLVVDNASRECVIERASRFHEICKFLKLDTNCYWAGGNNEAIRWADRHGPYDWLLFANNDVIVTSGWYDALCQVASAEPKAGVIGFKVFGEFRRTHKDEYESYLQSFELGQLNWRFDEYISGCFLSVRSACFRNLGLFDEHYKMYGEEDDMLHRIRLAGWSTLRCNFPVWHLSEYSSRKVPLISSYLAIRNVIRTNLKFNRFGVIAALGFCLRTFLRMVNPYQAVDLEDSCRRRLKPTMNPFLNTCLLASAIIWNITHLVETLRLGAAAQRLALQTRQNNVNRINLKTAVNASDCRR